MAAGLTQVGNHRDGSIDPLTLLHLTDDSDVPDVYYPSHKGTVSGNSGGLNHHDRYYTCGWLSGHQRTGNSGCTLRLRAQWAGRRRDRESSRANRAKKARTSVTHSTHGALSDTCLFVAWITEWRMCPYTFALLPSLPINSMPKR